MLDQTFISDLYRMMLQDIGKLLIQLNTTAALMLISSLFSGIGNDPRENRKFNMIKQGLDYDKEGEYVRLWVEELRGLRGGRAHHPWTLGPGELTGSGLELGVTYPRPLVTAPEWARHTGSKAGAGGQQRGVDFYFKSKQNHNNHNQNRKKPLRGGRVQ